MCVSWPRWERGTDTMGVSPSFLEIKGCAELTMRWRKRKRQAAPVYLSRVRTLCSCRVSIGIMGFTCYLHSYATDVIPILGNIHSFFDEALQPTLYLDVIRDSVTMTFFIIYYVLLRKNFILFMARVRNLWVLLTEIIRIKFDETSTIILFRFPANGPR